MLKNMRWSSTLFAALFTLQSFADVGSQCSVTALNSNYQQCSASYANDARALLSCIQTFVAACQEVTDAGVDAMPVGVPPKVLVQVEDEADQDRPPRRKLLTSDDPNYFSFASPESRELGDVNHVEFYLSIKYPLYDQTIELKSREEHLGALLGDGDWSHFLKPDRAFFHYNGLYDFYMLDDGENGQYDSSPITSRRQNPGLSLEYDWGGGRTNYSTTRYGYFHESNGQQLDEEDLARFEFLSGRDSEEYALSQVSRGWDYWQLRFDRSNYPRNSVEGRDEYFERQGNGFWHWSAELRWYRPDQVFGLGGSREDEVWWDGPRNDSIEDFDGLRLMAEYSPERLNWGDYGLTPRLEVKTSQEEPFKRISYRVGTGIYLDKVNFSLFYFDGYGKDPSTYHLRSRYWALGLELR